MTNLVTLDDYKETRKINSTTRDARIESLIGSISSLVETYCNRKFGDYYGSGNEYTEWFDAKTNEIDLTGFPVRSVVSVKTSDDGGVTQTTLTEAAGDKDGYFVDLEKGRIYTQKQGRYFLTYYDTPYRSLEVAYTYGYDIAADPTENDEALPQDLKLVVLDLVEYYLDSEHVPSRTMGTATMENPIPSTTSFPAHIRRILDLYRYSP